MRTEDHDRYEEILGTLKKIASGIGWCSFWLFLITLHTCREDDVARYSEIGKLVPRLCPEWVCEPPEAEEK